MFMSLVMAATGFVYTKIIMQKKKRQNKKNGKYIMFY